MHTINLHIDETVPHRMMGQINAELLATPHIQGVAYNHKDPHEMLIEVDNHHNMAIEVINLMHNHGLHVDVIGC